MGAYHQLMEQVYPEFQLKVTKLHVRVNIEFSLDVQSLSWFPAGGNMFHSGCQKISERGLYFTFFSF